MNNAHAGVGSRKYNRIMRTGVFVSSLILIASLFSACQHHVVGNSSLTAPTISNAVGGPKKVTISWAPVSGATYYNLYFRTGTTVNRSDGFKIAGVTSPRVVTGLADSTEYAFIVTAVNGSGESNASKVVTATTDSLTSGPTITSAVGGQGNVVVSWSPVNGASSYNLYWAADTSVTMSTGNEIMGATSPQTISGLAAGTQYAFIVTTVDSAGEGTPSNVMTAVTQPRNYLFVANQDSNTASVFAIGSGAFTLASLKNSPLSVGKQPSAVGAADLNGDGLPDMIVANKGDNTISVLMNSMTQKFSTPKTINVGMKPSSISTADLNSDGKPDVIVADQGSNSISVLENMTMTGASTPSFSSAQSFGSGSTPDYVTTADLNGNGKPDVIVANQSTNKVSVLMNKTTTGSSSLSFSTPQSFAVGTQPVSVTVADVNGDGKPDLIVTNENSNSVSILINTTPVGASAVSFATAQTINVGSSPRSVAMVDINGDGKPDMVVANNGDNNVSVLMNKTASGSMTAQFSSALLFDVGLGPVSVKSFDLNGDGKPDLIVANKTGNTISVLMNTTAAGSMTPDFASHQSMDAASPAGIVIAHTGSNMQNSSASPIRKTKVNFH